MTFLTKRAFFDRYSKPTDTGKDQEKNYLIFTKSRDKMGSLVTKLTTNNVELDESGFSDVVFTQVIRIKHLKVLQISKHFCFTTFISAGRKDPSSFGSTTNTNRTVKEPFKFRSEKPLNVHHKNSNCYVPQ